jgi:hypothetical protein
MSTTSQDEYRNVLTFAEDLRADYSRQLEKDIREFETWQSAASQRVVMFWYRASFHIDLFAGNGEAR